MDDIVQCSAAALVQSRAVPLLFVIDADANVLFAPAAVDAEFSHGLDETLRSIAASLSTPSAPSPRMFKGFLVRAERLRAAAGDEVYAIFFERIVMAKQPGGMTSETVSEAGPTAG